MHSARGRFVDPKTQEQQGGAVLFRTRSLFIRQRTEAVNALRAHLYEFGYIAPAGIQNVKQLVLVNEAALRPTMWPPMKISWCSDASALLASLKPHGNSWLAMRPSSIRLK
jgi:hypothetical protein